MRPPNGPVIREVFAEGAPIDAALKAAVREAIRRHRLDDNPVPEWRDGRLVWVEPAAIPLRDTGKAP